MYLNLRNIFLIIILMLSVLFMPALMGAGIMDLMEEDDLTDPEDDDLSVVNDFPTAWIRIPIHQMAVLLRLGISIFALCVVYLGGRSKHRRFNDRTLDHENDFISYPLLKTALINRAVFHFLLPAPLAIYSTKYPINRLLPILIPNSRRY